MEPGVAPHKGRTARGSVAGGVAVDADVVVGSGFASLAGERPSRLVWLAGRWRDDGGTIRDGSDCEVRDGGSLFERVDAMTDAMTGAMTEKVLVAYASKHGSTAEIAEQIGAVLRDADLPVHVAPVREVTDLTPYTAVVLGSAVYMGRWRREASGFVTRHADQLAGRDTWIFSSGPTDEGDPEQLSDGWTFPKPLQATIERIAPRDVKLFHGKLDPDELGVFERWIVRTVKAPMGDFRDPATIEAWARGIAATLQERDATP